MFEIAKNSLNKLFAFKITIELGKKTFSRSPEKEKA